MNSDNVLSNIPGDSSMLQAYKRRFFWYLGVVLLVFGANGLPLSRFVSVLIPGALHYLTMTIPIAVAPLLIFIFLEGDVQAKIFGLKIETICWLVMVFGAATFAWEFFGGRTFVAIIGISVIFWGGELMLWRGEAQYWEARRKARRDRA